MLLHEICSFKTLSQQQKHHLLADAALRQYFCVIDGDCFGELTLCGATLCSLSPVMACAGAIEQ
jgi:hypothetical protein